MMGKVYSDRYWLPGDFEAVAQFKEITRKHGRSMPQFALAWILNNKANSIKQLEENTGAIELTLTEEELKACDEVWHQLRPPRFFYGAQQLYR